MKMTLIKIDTNSLREDINIVEKNTNGKAYLFMNNQTMRCLNTVDPLKFESLVTYSNEKDGYKYRYKGNKIIIDNDIEFGKVEIR